MLKVFIGQLREKTRIVEVLYPNLGSTERASVFGEKIFEYFTAPIVEVVEHPKEADYILLPHHYNNVKNDPSYLESFISFSKKYDKKIVVFFTGDSDEEILLPNSIVFRHSQYRYKKLSHEIIMPAYAVDLASDWPVLRNKSIQPSVSFCGWARYATFSMWFKYVTRNALLTFSYIFGNPYALVHKKGIYFRKKAIAILKKSPRIDTHFILRNSYTHTRMTLEGAPDKVREEYIQNMNNADFALAPKGNGNFSVRFYEALSLGRIPILIDTECVLPQEEEIDYDSFILRVNYKDIKKLPEIIEKFYDSLSLEQYIEMQRKARSVFVNRLRIDIFLQNNFTKTILDRYS